MPLDATPTSARAELIRINQEIEAASAERDQAQEAFNRLERPAQLLEEAVAAHAAEKAANDARLIEWYTNGCAGERPAIPPSLLSAEHRLGEAHRDIDASAGVLETARKALDEANVRLGSLAAAKQSAIYRSVVEAAARNLSERCLPAIIASLMELAAVQSVAAALRSMRDAEALSAAMSIERAVFETRNSIAVRGNMTAATAFLNTLAQDPMAELPVPQCDVERVNLPVIRPMEDGAQYINRASTEPAASPVETWIPAMAG